LISEEGCDLAFLSETWYRPTGDESDIAAATPPNYTLKSFPRLNGAGGGLALVYKNSIASCVSVRSLEYTYASFECFKVRLSCENQNVTFLSLYRPPPSKKNKLTNKMFFDNCSDLLESVLACDQLVVLGDVNFHFDSKTDSSTAVVKQILHHFSLQQLVHVPTHRRGHTLDWVITSPQVDCANVCVRDKLISDHFVVGFSLRLRKPQQSTKTVASRNLRKIEKDVFRADVSAALADPSVDPSQLADQYNCALGSVLDKHAPLVTRRVTDRPSAPWMSPGIKAAKQERRRAERQRDKSGLTVHSQIFGHHRNVVNRMIRDAKTHYMRNKITSAESSRELFKLCNTMLGASTATVLPGNIAHDKLAERFNDFFCEKIVTLRKKLDSYPPAPSSTPDPPFSGTPLSSFKPVSCDYVKKLLLSMPKKSCALDPIPADLFFECIDELSPVVTDILNESLSTGTVPPCFKHALVTPLLKKTNLDPDQLKNYRPVSNLPFLSKVLERAVLDQLNAHFAQHDLLEPFQSAYRKCHSTETALLKVTNDLLLSSDQGKVSVLTLLDLSAAFDTIDHTILCKRLSTTFGCTGTALDWFQSYISSRTQAVLANGTQSTPSPLHYGVPQGSVLGPVLFTIYMQPLSHIIKDANTFYHFFADDTQLHNSALPAETPSLARSIVGCVENVSVWMSSNKLKMNEDKTETIAIGTKSKLLQCKLKALTLQGADIPFSKTVRNLGIIFDESLSMEAQVSNLCKVIYFHLRRLCKIRVYLSVEAANKLAVAFILSRLDFCNSLLAGVTEDKLSKLQRLQNSAARMVLKQPRHASASSLLKTLHWLPVKARIEYKIASICYKCIITDTMPSYLSSLLHPYRPCRTLRSQDALLLESPRYSLKSFGQRSFSVFGPATWNSLPLSLRQSNSLPTFKKNLKTFLFLKHLS